MKPTGAYKKSCIPIQAGRKPKASEQRGKMNQNFVQALKYKNQSLPHTIKKVFEWKFSRAKLDPKNE